MHATVVQILKLYAWEPSFQNSLIKTREKELDQVKRINIINALSNIAWFLCPYLVSYLPGESFTCRIIQLAKKPIVWRILSPSSLNLRRFPWIRLKIAVSIWPNEINYGANCRQFNEYNETNGNFWDNLIHLPVHQSSMQFLLTDLMVPFGSTVKARKIAVYLALVLLMTSSVGIFRRLRYVRFVVAPKCSDCG